MFGAFLAGLLYGLIALLIYKFGSGWLNRLLPPVVIGSVIIVIGLGLAGVAVDMAIGALISTIPTAVMGGVSILLFGIIASAGLRMLVENKVDFSDKRNLVIASVILVIGVGGAALRIEGLHLEIEGMALATIVGIVLNLILPKTEIVEKNESEEVKQILVPDYVNE